MTRLAQSSKELEVFRAFARVSGLGIDDATIQSRPPPEPDILCETKDGRCLAFELTELIDEAHMKRIAMVLHTKDALSQFLQNHLDEKDRVTFESLYKRGMLHFDFDENANLIQRKEKFASVFRILLECRPSLSEFVIKHDPELMPVLKSIRVKKSTINGPLFDVAGYGWLGDPTEVAISRKLAKTSYSAEADLHLLAYIDWDILPPSGAWIPAAESAIAALDKSQFVKVWVYNVEKGSVDFEYPK